LPIFAGTRPFEVLPFQWSCHIEKSLGRIEHAEFLDLGSEPPMRRLAESILEALGTTGPIVVYTPYERRVLNELAARYGDLAGKLAALAERIVDLYPATRRHYYHPALHGSWSIKAVLPTVAPDLRYEALGEVRDGLKAQTAYFEAVDAKTTETRRAALRRALLEYCRYDTLALVRLVEFFAR
jgi:predicted RecB family nuclease